MSNLRIDIYGGKNPEEIPAYGITQAAHCLQLSPATVRSWVVGREYSVSSGPATFHPLITVADTERGLLSFQNLVELHVLSSLRQKYKIKLPAVRKSIDFLQSRYGSSHPLIDQEMLTDGKDLFIEKYEHYVGISQGGQSASKDILFAYLQRIERDISGSAIRLFPFANRDYKNSPKLISIDPRVRFGRPCIATTGIPTAIIAERHKAGDSITFLAEDYVRTAKEIEEAVRYESRIAS